jgi:DNA-binding response OmpR family regulator
MDDYMSKPISPDALVAKIYDWLAKTAGTTAVAG